MTRLPHVNGLIALAVDGLLPEDDGGVVTVRPDGRMRLDYPVRPFLSEAFRHAQASLARLQLAAGATRVATAHAPRVELTGEADLPRLEAASYGAHDLAIYTAHQMG